jgi:hypothetical protein
MEKEDLVVRYSDKDLESFRIIIEEKISKAQRDLELIRSAYMNDGNNGTEDTAPTFKAFEEGSQTMSKEANTQLAIRQEKFIRDLKKVFLFSFLSSLFCKFLISKTFIGRYYQSMRLLQLWYVQNGIIL